MRKLLAAALIGAAMTIAACHAGVTQDTELHHANLVADETPCGPEHNRLCK